MSAEELPESQQESEYEALSAIYGDDLKDLRGKHAWNKWSPLDLTLSLIPQQGSSGVHEVHAKLDLHIKCSKNYPHSVPTISLENHKGLSNNALIQLKQELDEKADDLKGEVMIYQLSQHVKEFLLKHNVPSSKSFYDQMLKRRKEEEEKDLETFRIENNKKRQHMLKEIQQREEMLKSELRSRRDHRHNSSDTSDPDSDVYRRSSNSNTSFSESSDDCNHKDSVLIEFSNREVQRGKCINHISPNSVIFGGVDRKSGELVLITEWIIHIRGNVDQAHIAKQLGSIEQELNYLMKLKHQNLAHYFNIKWQAENDTVSVYIAEEFIQGSNCSFLIQPNSNLNSQFIQYISKGVLSALDYLHRNNVVHKDVKETCIHFNDKGTVILSSYSVHRRLIDLATQSSISTYYSKKTDIYKFGKFILSLLKGTPITDEDADIPTSIPSDLYDFLKKCLCKDEKERFTATQLLNHSFFVTPIANFSPKRNVKEISPIRNESPDLIQNELLNLPLSQSSGQSRIQNEFEFLQNLGKGAFGDVIKVRNKLDGGYYAIKRIKLNPRNRQLNKKIVREVKLLSRLNHENVVRYYNSWIETTKIVKDEDDTSTAASELVENIPRVMRKDDFTINDNHIEELAPPLRNAEISITYDSKSQSAFDPSSDEESSDEEETNWRVINEDSDSDGIEFEKDENAESTSEESVIAASTNKNSTLSRATSSSDNVVQVDCMYIQMEFCEKSTLRIAIDNNLYQDESRVWRLFREIVEGLAHIHQQGMIHRDLKPVNIFLDFDDHVKIGDFGLATTSIASKLNENTHTKSIMELEDPVDESKTGFIGTALYVAPELGTASKAIYNQKVDIYSLGIIFFEMCYKPLDTNMERIKILTKLRTKEIILPQDFDSKQNTRQVVLIRWLLEHDISKRPTSQELLLSEHIPPPVLEECRLRELVRHTLSNTQLKGYKYLIASCFNQDFTPAQDITYDKDPSASNVTKPLQLYDLVRQVTVKIFKQHGGQNLSTPVLIPKSQYYDGVESCVKLMTHFGGIVTLPHDLRVPFARYVAWNGITLLRRYSVERVYREKKVFGFIPRELYECAFDIVTPTPGNLMVDAEILYIVYEIINELPSIKNKHILIRMNHTSLVNAILLHFGIKEKRKELCRMISNVRDGKVHRDELQSLLASLNLSDNSISTLTNLFNSEFELSKASNELQVITRKKSGDASTLAKQALQDLKSIAHNAEAYGVTFDMVVAPGVLYNFQHYSGVVFQFVCELKKKHKVGNMEVLAAGGRYDSMITSYRNQMQEANMLSKGIHQSAVGISISLDRLVQAIQKEQNDDLPKMEFLDVAVCSVGSKSYLKEKTKILRSMWAVGIRAALMEANNIEEIKNQCSELKVPHIILLKDCDQNTVKVFCWERDRFQEKTYKISEVVENMVRIVRNSKESERESTTTTNLSRTDNKQNEKIDQEAKITVSFVTSDKLSSVQRKRYEVQIKTQLASLFQRLSGYVTVLGLSTESAVLRTLSAHLEFETEQLFNKSVQSVIEKHQRYKKYLMEVCDVIYEHKLNRTRPIVVLYSLPDSLYKMLF